MICIRDRERGIKGKMASAWVPIKERKVQHTEQRMYCKLFNSIMGEHMNQYINH